jgi:predicted peptidase
MTKRIRLEERSGSYGKLRYLLFSPSRSAPTPPPLILFLHGRGESLHRSDEPLVKVKAKGLPMLAGDGGLPAFHDGDFPSWSSVPRQLGQGGSLNFGDLVGLLDELAESGRADANRTCLTGISMGGGRILAPRRQSRALMPVSGCVPEAALG